MTAVFNKHGLNFQYPENWEIQESYAPDQALEIYVLAPSGSFWALMAYTTESAGDQLMQQVLESLDGQYEGLESEPVNQTVSGIPLSGINSSFFCMDLVVTNKMRTVRVAEHQLLIMYQGENREFEKYEMVFEAITTSLLNGLKEEPS